jgi:uncharacterized membrane protein YfcA
MDFSLFQYFLIIAGSFLAGIINTFAGNGSVITLSLLTDVAGLPANIANATNRVNIIFQSLATGAGFHKNRMIDFDRSKWMITLTLVGSVAGVYAALIISNENFLKVFRYMMIVMLILVLINPERWLRETNLRRQISWWINVPVYLAVGFYGGFIQMGAGVFFLAALVLVSGYSMMEANGFKTVVIAIYTLLVLVIFASQGLIDWRIGLLMSVGQTAGGYISAAYMAKMSGINVWAYRLLILIIVFSILSQFGIIKL